MTKYKAPDETAQVAQFRKDEPEAGFWRSCSGCHELNEGHDTGPHSPSFGCALGLGCRECGGLGAVWDDTDYADMAKSMMCAGTPATSLDVIALVIAARAALDSEELSDSAALDKAVEAFASRVCYDDEGGSLPEAHADPCTCTIRTNAWRKVTGDGGLTHPWQTNTDRIVHLVCGHSARLTGERARMRPLPTYAKCTLCAAESAHSFEGGAA